MVSIEKHSVGSGSINIPDTDPEPIITGYGAGTENTRIQIQQTLIENTVKKS